MKGCMSSQAYCWGNRAQKASTIYSRWSHVLAGTGTGGSHRQKIPVKKHGCDMTLSFFNPHMILQLYWGWLGKRRHQRGARCAASFGLWVRGSHIPQCPALPRPPSCKCRRASAQSWLLWFWGTCEVISKSFSYTLPRFGMILFSLGFWERKLFFLFQRLAHFLPELAVCWVAMSKTD